MSYRVLIVEDTPDLLDSLTDLLVMEGFEVITACNGKEALHLMNMVKIDLLLSDLLMPQMDGYQLIQEVRANPEWENIPVLIFSAKPEEVVRQQVLKLGANAFLPKPSTSELIVESLKKLLI